MGLGSPARSTPDRQQLDRLLALGQDLLADLELPVILRRIVETARALTGARYGALGVLDDDRRELAQFITDGIDEATHRAIGDLPRGRGVLGVLIDDPRPLRLDDVGDHPRSYGFPPGHPRMSCFLGMPVRIGDEVWGNLYLTDKVGASAFTDADEAALSVLASWAGVAVQRAHAYEREHIRRLELEQAVSALEATTAIARALGGETDLDIILELIAKRGRNLVQARSLVLLMLDGDDLVVQAQAGELDPMTGRRVPVDGSISGHVLERGRSERLGDLPTRLHFAMSDAVKADVALFVPVLFRGRRLGVLNAFDKLGGDEFTRDDERLLEAFAASAATAVATAQDVANRELRRSIEATENERRRWARELHDETLQDLAGIRLLLGTIKGRPDVGEEAGAQLDRALDQLALNVTGLRQLIADLRPAALDQIGLGAALEALVTRLATTTDLEVALDSRLAHEEKRAAMRLVPAVEETAYRVTQEGLNNAVKHARATRAEVTLLEDEHVVTVTVADDGRGFDPAARSDGFGLVGMRERVALVGGTLELDSAPGRGTIVRAVLPARHREQDAAPARDAGLRTG